MASGDDDGAASGGGSWLIFLIILVTVINCSVLRQHAQREMGWVSFSVAVVSFSLSGSAILVLPFDLWEVLAPIPDNEKVLLETDWELLYWLSSMMSWVVIPILIEYNATGNFSFSSKFRAIWVRDTRWSAGYAAAAIALFVMFISSGGRGVQAWCLALSNAWGLLYVVVLLGYGLLAVPRHLWRLANPVDQLSWMYSVAVSMDEARLTAQFELQDVINEARSEMSSRGVQMWDPMLERAFNILQGTVEESELLHCELTYGAKTRANMGDNNSTFSSGLRRDDMDVGEETARLESLGDLHRALKQASHEARRAASRWDGLVQGCLLLEDVEEQLFPSALEVASSCQDPCFRMLCRSSTTRNCWHRTVILWLGKFRFRVLRLLAVICSALSLVIVLGQLTMFSETASVSGLSLLFRRGLGYWETQVLCLVPLVYMVGTAYWSIFRLKICGLYGLYPNHGTDSGSLLWCASALGRIVLPLCYHFLLLIDVPDTSFGQVMGQMSAVPFLGESFNLMLPCLVGVIAAFHQLNVYPRAIHLVGLDILEVEGVQPGATSDNGDLPAEGRRLVDRERRRRSEDRSLLELHDREGGGVGGLSSGAGSVTMPLRLQIQALIEDGTLPMDWNAHSPP